MTSEETAAQGEMGCRKYVKHQWSPKVECARNGKFCPAFNAQSYDKKYR